jgi:hypothetical protein
MLFTPLLLVCMQDMSMCKVQSTGSILPTEKQCMVEIRGGIEAFESVGFVVMDYQCATWEKRQPT